MLIPFSRIPLILICSYYCVVTSLFGALQFEGFVSYEGYSRGKIAFTTIEQFSVKWENGQYLFQTVFYKTVPTNLNCGAWLPSSQQFGTDGRDLYYLQEYDRKTNRNIIALIEPGIVPNSGPSPSISLLWHAYGSGLLLKGLDIKEIRSPQPDADPKQGRLNPTLVKIQYGMVKDNPLFLEHMEYLSDGKVYDRATKQITYTEPEPFSSGFTQAKFRVEQYLTQNNLMYPKTFVYEQFSPTIRSNRTFLEMDIRLKGEVTNCIPNILNTNWMPELPGKRIGVADNRFSDVVTNWDTVTYSVTNSWLSRDDPNLQRQVNVYEKIAPIRGRGDSKKGNVVWVKVILIFAIVLSAVAYALYAAKKRKRT